MYIVYNIVNATCTFPPVSIICMRKLNAVFDHALSGALEIDSHLLLVKEIGLLLVMSQRKQPRREGTEPWHRKEMAKERKRTTLGT